MFKAKSDNTIHITRGDTGVLNLSLKRNNEPYILGESDTCVLTVKKNTTDAKALMVKQLVDGQFTIEPSDTAALEFGIYKYDIQVTTSEGVVCTVVAPHNFIIEDEVSW